MCACMLTLANLIRSRVSVLGSHSMDDIRPASSTLLLVVFVAVAVTAISASAAMDAAEQPLPLRSVLNPENTPRPFVIILIFDVVVNNLSC